MRPVKAFLFFVVLLLLAGCASKEVSSPFVPEYQSPDLQAEYQQKVENLLVLFDASTSLYEGYNGVAKVEVEKNTVLNMIDSLPADISLAAGLRTFGPMSGSGIFASGSQLVVPIAPLGRGAMKAAVQQIYTGGLTPLETPLVATVVDLREVQGRTAVIMISDGIDNGAGDVLTAVQSLRDEYGDRLCLSTIQVGDDPVGKKLLEKIVVAGDCGYATSADTVASGRGMADFVKKVFYARSVRVDSDRDGVYDDRDRCANTPIGIGVDVDGCPVDGDGDGVYDYLDKCPETMRGLTVDAQGCAPPVAAVELQVEFDSGKDEVKPIYRYSLRAFAEYMQSNLRSTAIIEGHTDNVGSARYNLDLSRRRAESVKAYLVEHFRVGAERLTAHGYGMSRPVAANTTESGRRQNRRVMAIIDRGFGGL